MRMKPAKRSGAEPRSGGLGSSRRQIGGEDLRDEGSNASEEEGDGVTASAGGCTSCGHAH